MSKVMIISLCQKNYHGGSRLVMSWEEYQTFCRVTPGEGETWKAVLV